MEGNNKLNRKQLLGYGVAGIGDSAGYSLINSFLLFFLTSVVHIPNVPAGIINSAGGIWNALMSPVIGYISDNSSNKYGRRRPYMLVGGIVLLLSISLLFTNIDASSTIRFFYYGIMTVVFWTSFGIFFIPYLALGAEITNDYDERTKVRMYTSTFNMFGIILGMVMPTIIVSFLAKYGIEDSESWQVAGIFVAIITFISIMLSWNSTRWVSNTLPQPKTENRNNTKSKAIARMINEYKEVLLLKPMKYLVLGSIFYLVINTLAAAMRMYYSTYNLKLTGVSLTFVFFFATVMNLFMIPIPKKLSSMYGKKTAFIITAICGFVGSIFFGFYGIDSLPVMCAYLLVLALPAAAYWQLFPSMIYDVCEVDEFVHGKTRQGIVVSIQSLAESLSGAITVFGVGLILDFSGFDGTVIEQTASAKDWILYMYTFLPAIFFLLTIIMVYMYPLNKTRFNLLKKALMDKKDNKIPDTKGLEKIL